MFSKRIKIAVFLMLIAAFALTACGDTPETIIQTVEVEKIVKETVQVEKVVTVEVEVEGKTVVVTATPEPMAPPPPMPEGKIVLWGWSYDVMQSTGLIDEFKAAYPGIDVEIVIYGAGDTYQNLQLAISAGEGGPDIAQVENSHLASFVELGGLTDISEQVNPYLDIVNAYKWQDAIKDGKYYAMPWDSGPVVMYYRRDVFEAAGLPTSPEEVSDLVSTWDGYLDACITIKEKTGMRCFANSQANNDARLFEIVLWQQGMGYYNNKGEITVDSAENVATLEKLGEFWDAQVTSDEVAWTDGWYAELQSQDEPIASIIEASWLGVFLKTWIAGDTAGKWGVAYMPTMEKGQPRASNDGGSTLVITEQSQNKEAAWAFIEFMLGRRESQLKQFAYSDFLPSLETTYDDHLFIEPDSFFGGQVARQVYLNVAKDVPIGYIYSPNYALMNGHVATAIQRYATGEMSAQEALAEAADAIRLETGMK